MGYTQEDIPYILQDPQRLLMKYGSVEALGRAAALGLEDQTALTLAAMLDKRMKAAAQPQPPQATIAQQVFSPPQPQMPPQGMPGGLGATPQAAAMPPMPPQGMPPMGTPQGGPPMPEVPANPMEEAPAAYAEGGLTTLPVPDTMFDEPDDGGYARGGIVAFAAAGPVGEPAAPAAPAAPPTGPTGKYGFGSTFEEQLDLLRKYAPQQDKYGKKLTEYYEGELDPAKMEARRKQDVWAALADIGAEMASTPGGLFKGAAAGLKAAQPGIRERAKERRADQRDAVKALAAQEGLTNKQAMDAFNVAGELQKAQAGFLDAEEGRKLQERMNRLDNATRLAAERIASGSRITAARIGAKSSEAIADKNLQAQIKQARQLAFGQASKDVKADDRYIKAIRKGDNAAAQTVLNEYYQGYLNQIMGEGVGTGGGPAVPSGYEED